MKEPPDRPGTALPAPTAALERFEEALRKGLVEVTMHPDSVRALRDGLTSRDLRERRLWWELVLGTLLPVLEGKGEGKGGVTITFVQNVPAPPHEDGPTETAIDVTPGKSE